MVKKKIGLRDIAERAGVANSTVSHVLNGSASISDEVRARVLSAAGELGYLAQRQSKGAIAAMSRLLVAMPEDAMPENDLNMVSWTILSALSRACEDRGIQLVPHPMSGGQAPADDVLEAAETAQADGLILLNDDRGLLLSQLSKSDLPAVLINGEDADMAVDSVTPGNRFAAQMATNWLIARGHRHLLHLTWPGRKTVRRRLDGFLDALDEAGLRSSENSVLQADGFEPGQGEARVTRWLLDNGGLGKVTALFCAADNLAFGAIRALHAGGYKVPDDVSVMGFDGVSLGEFHTPPLTTVSAPWDQFATEALSLLQQRILAHNQPRAARRVELGCRIINRSSVAELGKKRAVRSRSTTRIRPNVIKRRLRS